jgi:hypothetical protein
MRLIFCDIPIMQAWMWHGLAARLKRKLTSEAIASSAPAFQHVEYLRGASLKPACTISSAAAVITSLYKHELPFSGRRDGFMERKSCARTALKVVHNSIELLSPTRQHFLAAEALWFALCVRDDRTAFAGFADYVDAALVSNPPDGYEISHVVVGHAHLPYVLRKIGFAGMPHVISSGR